MYMYVCIDAFMNVSVDSLMDALIIACKHLCIYVLFMDR